MYFHDKVSLKSKAIPDVIRNGFFNLGFQALWKVWKFFDKYSLLA
jgi:hypothetical protein